LPPGTLDAVMAQTGTGKKEIICIELETPGYITRHNYFIVVFLQKSQWHITGYIFYLHSFTNKQKKHYLHEVPSTTIKTNENCLASNY
jgi:hypothetical protein